MHPKMRKFLKSPLHFATDLAKKKLRTHPAGRLFSGSYVGNRTYTVVSAVYQAEQYLDDFMQSLVNQTMSFERHIHVVLVDDGSKDGSLDIAYHWQKKYPNNIIVITQENGGAASARNAGLAHVKGDWVTFTDPDDILDACYFENVDRFLDQNKSRNIGFIGANMLFFMERTKRIRNTHPLKFKFADGNKIVELRHLGKYVQMSAASGFFRSDILIDTQLLFDVRIKPSFEDAHFIARYFLKCPEIDVGYLADARYYYRKRENKSSTLDNGWAQRERFSDLMRHGCLELLQSSTQQYGSAPVWLQNAVLNHMVWDLKHIYNNPQAIAYIGEAAQEEYLNLCRQCFDLIDSKVIEDFDLAHCNYLMRVGLLGLFKNAHPVNPYLHIDTYDSHRKMVKVSYCYMGDAPELDFFVNGEKAQPAYPKVRVHSFIGHDFVREYLAWFDFGPDDHLAVHVGGKNVPVYLNEKSAPDALSYNALMVQVKHERRPKRRPWSADLLRWLAKLRPVRHLYNDIWLLMDRDVGADDNAEHVYRYLMHADSSQKIAFILRRESPDWSRLAKEGFRLIAFGSLQHRLATLHARYVISSHADAYVISFLSQTWYGDLLKYRLVFLQHGVTQFDISSWLNPKPIDLFITSTPAETASITAETGTYKFTQREVVMTGMPRHDRLLQMAHLREKLVVIMPGWRKYLVGETLGAGNLRHVNPDFIHSDYAKAWKNILHAPQLKALADKHGYKFLFYPHKNIEPYLDLFNTPDWVDVYCADGGESIQTLFARAALMITDYSSVAFEMGFLQRPVIYYQFDWVKFFGGSHIGQAGYFDYQRDGFGPVSETEKEVLDALERLLMSDAEMPPDIKKRAENTFPYRDGLASKRVVDAIHKIR